MKKHTEKMTTNRDSKRAPHAKARTQARKSQRAIKQMHREGVQLRSAR